MTTASSTHRTGALASLGAVILAGAVVAAQFFVVPNAPKFPLATESRVYETADQKIKVTVIAHEILRPLETERANFVTEFGGAARV